MLEPSLPETGNTAILDMLVRKVSVPQDCGET